MPSEVYKLYKEKSGEYTLLKYLCGIEAEEKAKQLEKMNKGGNDNGL